MYAGCIKNNIPFKLWHKEGIKTDLEADKVKKVGVQDIAIY